jgi:long-subunit fatty acid transport protein
VLETESRHDERGRLGFGVTRRINVSLSLEAGYQYTKNRSNSSLYEYDQHLVNTGIVWDF